MDKNNNSRRQNSRKNRNRGERIPSDAILPTGQFRMPASVTFPRNVIGFPDRLTTILKYSENNRHGPASPTPSAAVWAVNSCFDPNYSGTGHQPSYFDVLKQVYGRYFVKAFKLEIEVVNQLATTAFYTICMYSDQDVSSSTVEQLTEGKFCKTTVSGINTGSGPRKIQLPWMSTLKIMGQPFVEADDNMYALISASPTDLAYGIVKCAAVDGTTNMDAYVKTTLLQEVVFKDLDPLWSS